MSMFHASRHSPSCMHWKAKQIGMWPLGARNPRFIHTKWDIPEVFLVHLSEQWQVSLPYRVDPTIYVFINFWDVSGTLWSFRATGKTMSDKPIRHILVFCFGFGFSFGWLVLTINVTQEGPPPRSWEPMGERNLPLKMAWSNPSLSYLWCSHRAFAQADLLTNAPLYPAHVLLGTKA